MIEHPGELADARLAALEELPPDKMRMVGDLVAADAAGRDAKLITDDGRPVSCDPMGMVDVLLGVDSPAAREVEQLMRGEMQRRRADRP